MATKISRDDIYWQTKYIDYETLGKNDPHIIPENVVDELAFQIRGVNFRCDTLSTASVWLMSRGFTVECNELNYKYYIENKGGNWVVTVQ